MKRSTRIRLFLLVALSLLIAFGTLWVYSRKIRADATNALAHHFDSLRRGDLDSAMADYSPDFRPKGGQERWRGSIANLGILLTHSIAATWTTAWGSGGARVSFSVDTVYERGSFQEDFELFRPRGTTNFAIAHHGFD
jgi:hypothetical protein